MSSPVRLRVAPSPTGEPHIGNVYTGLVNQIYARKNGGKLIVRIEDTDSTRSTAESEQKILEMFRWIGIHWDEGPDVGGPHGPYRQSERADIYRKHGRQLLDEGKAFRCFCSAERLEEMRHRQMRRKQQPRYDGHCLALSEAESADRAAGGEPFVLRMKVPETGECAFTDEVYGPISIPWSQVDMQVLLKSDGMATYHLANVVDDHLMEISNVLRGEEWISSTPKHLLLYEYFGYQPPRYGHLPLLKNLDRTKLSKRKNPTSVSWFKSRGYHPAAIRLFLGLPFLSIGHEDELIDDAELEAKFDLGNVARSGGVFDLSKLDWLNARWIREKLTPESFAAWVRQWALSDGALQTGLELARMRIKTLGELPDLLAFLLAGDVTPDKAAFVDNKTDEATVARILATTVEQIEKIRDWNAKDIELAMREMASQLELKLRDVTRPLYLAVTGHSTSIPLFDSMALLGRAVCRYRLQKARDLFDWKRANDRPERAAD